MPELPEVETIVRQLRPEVVGKTIRSVGGLFKPIFKPSFEEVARNIKGLTILGIARRGKYIVFALDNEMRLVIHLRMTGRLVRQEIKKRHKYIRAVINFDDNTSLFFSDTRKFGRIWLYSDQEYEKATGIADLGIEPLQEKFTFKIFMDLFGHCRGILKNTLLRQDLIAGIGNIYADEICFRSRLHPATRLERMRAADFKRLYDAIRYCLEQGIKHKGTSVSDFVGSGGALGKHQNYLQVYKRKGGACLKCGLTIQKTKVASRGTFYCPGCQEKA